MGWINGGLPINYFSNLIIVYLIYYLLSFVLKSFGKFNLIELMSYSYSNVTGTTSNSPSASNDN